MEMPTIPLRATKPLPLRPYKGAADGVNDIFTVIQHIVANK